MRFAIIDIANMFARAQHVTMGDAYTKAGMALHIIFLGLRKLSREHNIDHMVFCTEGGSWRGKVYPAYKARRKFEKMQKSPREKEEDQVFYGIQKDFIEYLQTKTRCTVLHAQGIEGDDFVARWIQLHPNDEHFILSSDSDFVQLLAENVSIVDGVAERVITLDGVTNFKGQEMVFSIDSSSGKLKVPGTVKEVEDKHNRLERDKKRKDAAYEVKPFHWDKPSRADEWWRKALFVKIVRGDVGDNIFSSYPGVRYEGSSKKTGIREAWEDRNAGGYNW
ncbi:MAG: hypothetical protein EOP83_13010, partial [Verrucomicrobiaceae bacterium]